MTLIELILSMVIIALVFTVVPKMIAVTAKSSEQGKKEDAIFNAVSTIAEISYLAWDENLTSGNQSIMRVDESIDFNCTKVEKDDGNFTYRAGAFFTDSSDNGRRCEDNNTYTILGLDSGDDSTNLDDIDDFNNSADGNLTAIGYKCSSSSPIKDYNLTSMVSFVKDFNLSQENLSENNSTLTIRLSNRNSDKISQSTNVKVVEVKVTRDSQSSKSSLSGCIASFYYFAFNVGLVDEIDYK